MITTRHGTIRTTDPDDAPVFARIYDPAGPPRAAALDLRKEPILASADEVRELLARQEAQQGTVFAVENAEGEVRGFCGVRGANAEAAFAEMALMFADPADYATPLADETAEFLFERAYARQRLAKLIGHALDCEPELRDFFIRTGFESSGIQREVLYARGRWHGLETFSHYKE